MTSISPKDKDIITKLIGSACKILFITQVKVYKRDVKMDQTVALKGILCFIKNYQNDSLYFRLFSVNTKRILWSYRMTASADYNNPIPSVHTIATETVRIAFHFEDGTEADFLFQVIKKTVQNSKQSNEDSILEDTEFEEEYNFEELETSENEKSKASLIFHRLSNFVNLKNYSNNREDTNTSPKKYNSEEYLSSSGKSKRSRTYSIEDIKGSRHYESYKEFKRFITKKLHKIQRRLHKVTSKDKENKGNLEHQQERTNKQADLLDTSSSIITAVEETEDNYFQRIQQWLTLSKDNDKSKSENVSRRSTIHEVSNPLIKINSEKDLDTHYKTNKGFRNVISGKFQTVQRRLHKNFAPRRSKSENFGNLGDLQKRDSLSKKETLRHSLNVEDNIARPHSVNSVKNVDDNYELKQSSSTLPTRLVKEDIGYATNHRHLSHVGWDSDEETFVTRIINTLDNLEPFPTLTKKHIEKEQNERGIRFNFKSKDSLSSNYSRKAAKNENPNEMSKGLRRFLSKKLEAMQKKLDNQGKRRSQQFESETEELEQIADLRRAKSESLISEGDKDRFILDSTNIINKLPTKKHVQANESKFNRNSAKTNFEELTKNDIGYATNPRHVSHVGWDSEEETFVTRVNNYSVSDKFNLSPSVGMANEEIGANNEYQRVNDWFSLKKDDKAKDNSTNEKSQNRNLMDRIKIFEYPKPENVVFEASNRFNKNAEKSQLGRLTKIDIGNSSNPRHLSHVGWDNGKGSFVTRINDYNESGEMEESPVLRKKFTSNHTSNNRLNMEQKATSRSMSSLYMGSNKESISLDSGGISKRFRRFLSRQDSQEGRDISKNVVLKRNLTIGELQINNHQQDSKPKQKNPVTNQKGKLTKADIGNATNLRHVSHVGWDSNEEAFVTKVYNCN